MKLRISLTQVTFKLVILLGIFNSVFRYYLLETPFFSIVYLPQLLMLFIVAWEVFLSIQKNKIKRNSLLLLFALALALLAGMVFTSTLLQVAMGIYVLTPFFFGYLVYNKHSDLLVFKRYYLFLLIAGIIGVAVNTYYVYPWEGFSYLVNGKEIQGNRFWTSSGTRRLSGFGRSSFETAAYLLFLALMIISKKFKIGVLWLLTGGAIFYTNTKGIFLAFIVITILLLPWRFLPYTIKKGGLVFIVLMNIILPFASWIFSIKQLTDVKFLKSFEDRLVRSWPDALSLLSDSGNLLIGRGLGGIGVPQNIFEPEKALPGDNLFVYLTVLFGIGAFIIYIFLILSILTKAKREVYSHPLFYMLSLYVFVYGITTNIIELPIMAICLGLVIRFWTEQGLINKNDKSSKKHQY